MENLVEMDGLGVPPFSEIPYPFGVLDRVNYVNLFGKIKVFMKTTCHFFGGGIFVGHVSFFFKKKSTWNRCFFNEQFFSPISRDPIAHRN